MKTLALVSLAIAAAALIAVQHQQLGHLRAENAILQQASTEANQLKADLAKSTGAEADAEDKIARLREENRDLLKLRNQVYQLRQATAQFEQISAENQRLQSVAGSAGKPDAKQVVFQPIAVLVQNLYNQGLGTPEAAAQTFFWADRDGDGDTLSHCILPERWSHIQDSYQGNYRRNFSSNIASIEIAARRDIDANTVQLGIQFHSAENSGRDRKIVITLKLSGGEWKLDVDNLNF